MPTANPHMSDSYGRIKVDEIVNSLGQTVDLTNLMTLGTLNPVLFADQSAVPSATDNHGAIAHSHADGAMYFAHAGSWVQLANFSELSAVNNIDVSVLPVLP